MFEIFAIESHLCYLWVDESSPKTLKAGICWVVLEFHQTGSIDLGEAMAIISPQWWICTLDVMITIVIMYFHQARSSFCPLLVSFSSSSWVVTLSWIVTGSDWICWTHRGKDGHRSSTLAQLDGHNMAQLPCLHHIFMISFTWYVYNYL